MKTLAIRLDEDLHTRLTMLSKLAGTTVTDTIRTAIEQHLVALATDPQITAKAQQLTAEIEKEAAQQREALAALIGSAPKSSSPATSTRSGRNAK
jgi:hypothetical protein